MYGTYLFKTLKLVHNGIDLVQLSDLCEPANMKIDDIQPPTQTDSYNYKMGRLLQFTKTMLPNNG